MKEPLATGETAANLLLWDVVTAGGDPGSHAGHSEISRADLDEVENGVISERFPSADPGDEGSGGKRRLDGEVQLGVLGIVEAAKELFGSGNRLRERRSLELNLVDVQKWDVRMQDSQELTSEGGLSRTVGAGDEDGLG